MPIIRYILIGILVFLIIRLFVRHEKDNNQKNTEDKIKFNGKKISKSIGEYVDYEEVDEKV